MESIKIDWCQDVFHTFIEHYRALPVSPLFRRKWVMYWSMKTQSITMKKAPNSTCSERRGEDYKTVFCELVGTVLLAHVETVFL